MRKKWMATVLTAACAASLLTGCQSMGEAAGGSGNGAAKDAEKGAEDFREQDPEELSGTVVIWDWDGTTQQKYADQFQKKYPNVQIEIQDVAWDDYMTKLQTSYVSGMELPDIILGEIAWRGTLFEMGICDKLDQAPYHLDKTKMVASSVPLVSDQNGNILGVEMQVTPAGFAYKRDLARKYLGTDDPDEVAEMIGDWESFRETGLSVLEKSGGEVKMMPSLGDVILCTTGQNVVDYVEGSAVNITEKMKEPLEIAIEMRDAGIIGNIEMYSAAWYSAYASDEYLFYEAGAWCPASVIKPNAPEDEGNWAVTTPPGGSFNLGGTTLSIYSNSKNKEAAWAYLEYIYFSEEGGSIMYDTTGNYTCYQPYYEGESSPVGKEGPMDAFFGGQNLASYYIVQAAPEAKTSVQTRYDAIISDVFQALTPKYMSEPDIDAQKALELFREETALKAPEAEIN